MSGQYKYGKANSSNVVVNMKELSGGVLTSFMSDQPIAGRWRKYVSVAELLRSYCSCVFVTLILPCHSCHTNVWVEASRRYTKPPKVMYPSAIVYVLLCTRKPVSAPPEVMRKTRLPWAKVYSKAIGSAKTPANCGGDASPRYVPS